MSVPRLILGPQALVGDGRHLAWCAALADGVGVVKVARAPGAVTFEFGLGLQGLSLKAAFIAPLDLNQAVGQLAQGDVMLLHQDACGCQYPTTVVGKP